MNKQTFLLFGVLAISSLACVMSSAALLPEAPLYSTATVPAVEVTALPTNTAMRDLCAVVTAETAVHLRAGQGSDTRKIAHLVHGAIVTVMARSGDWWQVVADGRTGYVHARYLQETECE